MTLNGPSTPWRCQGARKSSGHVWSAHSVPDPQSFIVGCRMPLPACPHCRLALPLLSPVISLGCLCHVASMLLLRCCPSALTHGPLSLRGMVCFAQVKKQRNKDWSWLQTLCSGSSSSFPCSGLSRLEQIYPWAHTPGPSSTHHLLGRLDIVLHPLHRHDAALQVRPAANSPLYCLGHLVGENTSGWLQPGQPTGLQ